MKVMVYKEVEGKTSILLLPGKAAHKAPELFTGSTRRAAIDGLKDALETAEVLPEQPKLF